MPFSLVASSNDSNRHSDDVEFVTEYPFNGLFYSGGDDGKLKIWNRDMTLRYEQKLHEYRVHHAAFTNESIFTCSNSPFIKEWTHMGPMGLVEKRQLHGHEESVKKLRVARDKLVSGGDDGRLCVWHRDSGKIDTIFNVLEEIWDLKIDGKYIFTVRDRGISVWQTCDDDQRFMQSACLDEGRAPLVLTPDTVYCVDKATSFKILAYNRRSWELTGTIVASERIISSIAVTNDLLFSGGYDQTLRAFDRKTGTEVGQINLGGDIKAIHMTGAGMILVGISGGNVKLVEFKK